MNESASPDPKLKKIAIFGSGPAGLMAASTLLAKKENLNLQIDLFERRPSYGRKLLIAGSSGLNISHHTTLPDFISHYQGFTPEIWNRFFKTLSPEAWVKFVEGLGLETFVGTSDRYFVKEMKASGLLKAWTQDLTQKGVRFRANHEWKSFDELKNYEAVGFFLGGGSWEEEIPSWLETFEKENIKTVPFYPTNVGFEVAWKKEFLAEAEGKPLKNILFMTSKGSKAGELVVTRYGLEGTPIYFLGKTGEVRIDLKPVFTLEEIKSKLLAVKENMSPLRRIKKVLQLCDASLALLFHHSTAQEKANLDLMIRLLKYFPITLLAPRPLKEAISSGGGISLDEISTDTGQELMLKKIPGVFCGGEMLNWTAPTGGFLIQGSVTQGAVAAESMLQFLKKLL